ncbi:alpha-2 adrenergic receptor [Malaya genurostris]|uniref:alpha-2 adrenergic receptor n=1 Tax=Malaya genurostris TaxID=325434 RepID=UPI0026F3AD62|nr:alpha-2 adrenergic receptor [Malaya genurostris]
MDYPLITTGNISQEDFLAIVGGNSSLAGLMHGSATNSLNDSLNGVMATGGDNRTIFTGYPSGYTLPHIIIASIIVTILMIVIVVGNMLVIIAIATEKALKNIQNWFIASLAVADFFLGLVIMPFSLANELMGYWIFGNWWCDIHSAMDVLLCTSSIMNLCLISLDRYWSITKAIEYLKSRTPGRAAFMIAAVWIMSALVCIPPLLGWKAPRPEEHVELPQCQLSQDIGYVLYSALGSFYIPSCIMVFVYIRIYYAAKARARRGIRKKPLKPPSEQDTSFTRTNPMPSLPSASSVSVGAVATSANGQHPTSAANSNINNNNNNSLSNNTGQPPQQQQQIATIEPPPRGLAGGGGGGAGCGTTMSIPVVTCDFASDMSTSEAADHDHAAAIQEMKDTLKVGTPMSGLTSLPLLRGNNGAAANSGAAVSPGISPRNRALSVGIETDMVSEFDPSSSDSGVVSRCAVVKPLKFRLCQPIFGQRGRGRNKTKAMVNCAGAGGAGMGQQTISISARQTDSACSEMEPALPKAKPRDPEKEKRRIARKKEKRATLILGLIMGSFIACWLPFFFLYILVPVCKDCHIPDIAFSLAFWLGYMNSALNPAIYTIFNKDFRRAFRRILFK